MSGSPYVLLCQRLAGLAAETNANYAAVLDENGHMYGFSEPPNPEELAILGKLMDTLLATLERPLHRGGHVHCLRTSDPPYAFAESFADIYVLVLHFDAPPGPEVKLKALRALKDIEALTVSLPPDDPGAGEGAMRVRR